MLLRHFCLNVMIPNDIKNNMEDRVLSWFWVILFISAILFFKDLLTDMHVETLRIAEERERLEQGLEEQREKNEDMYEEFYAEINKSIEKAVGSLNRGDNPAQSLDYLLR